MTVPAWLLKFHAREALKNGDPVEAHRLHDQLVASGQRGAWPLRDDVVRGYIDQAEKALRQDDVDTAWQALLNAEKLDKTRSGVIELRKTLVRFAEAQIKAILESGNPIKALDAIQNLRERATASSWIDTWQVIAKDWLTAEELADAGDFAEARALVEKIRPMMNGQNTTGLDRFEVRLDQRESRFRDIQRRLYDATLTNNRSLSISVIEEGLSVAPRNLRLQENRSKIALEIQPAEEQSPALAVPSIAGLTGSKLNKFHLWIDGVGGFLVCTSNRVTIGQLNTDAFADILMQADIPKIAAALHRDDGKYLLEANRALKLNEIESQKALLKHGDKLEFANKIGFRFLQPVPGAASANLEPLQERRLPNGINSVVLMQDWLLISKTNASHILISDMENKLTIRKKGDALTIHFPGEFLVNGETHKDCFPVNGLCHIEGNGFSFALDPIE